ncbi:MAG: alkaline phosphatase family protein [Clostridia bacterium]|nr:alkaline phosphatase family protein [Clostridia bacterium]
MKKAVAVLLSLLLVFSCAGLAFAQESKPGFGDYEHVFIIGVDGAGGAFGQVDTPNFDRIFADNAYTHNGKAEYLTISAQNWGSILTGVDYETHGFTNDSTGDISRSSDSPNNSIFYYARQAFPDARLVSFNHWSNINHGIIENDLGVKKINRLSDPLVTDAIVNEFQSGKAPKLMFVQLDDADHAAHTYGGFSDEYYAAVQTEDGYLGQIYDAIDAKGLMKDSLFILVADHGETAGGHGGQTPEESAVVVAVAGHSVNQTMLSEETRNRDVAAIALYALGIEQPEHFTCSVPEGLFGESREKTVAPNPAARTAKDIFLTVIYRMVNLLVGCFDFLAK